jgi:phosphoglycolate phosphatase-like HAD superfamily hydrolase
MFDLDGTLIKSNSLDIRCLMGAIGMSLGIENADSDWTKYNYVTDAGIVSEIVERQLNRPVTDEELFDISKKLLELLQSEADTNREKFAPLPGSLDLICTLKTINNCSFAIATGCWKKSAHFKLSTAGFDVVNLPMASSDDSYHREEIMDIAYERARDFYGVNDFETITYVGDGLWDLKASQKMRYHFIGIASGDCGVVLRQEGASYILKDFSDKATFFTTMDEIWAA